MSEKKQEPSVKKNVALAKADGEGLVLSQLSYGTYQCPVEIRLEPLLISMTQHENLCIYRRDYNTAHFEKRLLSTSHSIIVNPVEPVNLPRDITSHFMIMLNSPLYVQPKITETIYLTFPIEVAIIVVGHKNTEVLDIISLTKPKYSLYGSQKSGMICKYWSSDVFSSIPDCEPHMQGVLELRINNTTGRWIKVTQVVFNAYGIKIYYDEELVSMKATMKLLSKEMAETEFINAPLRDGMKKSVELYMLKKLTVSTTKMVMEEGI